MSLLVRSRLSTTILLLHRHLHFSTTTSTTPLSLLKSESDPESILRICRSTPDLHQDRAAFSFAISKLKDAHHFAGIKSYLDQLKSRPDLQYDDRFHSQAIALYGQAGMFSDALRTFQEMEKFDVPRTVKSVNALLLACLAVNDHAQLERIYLEFPDRYELAPDLDTFNTVIKSYCETGKSSSVYEIISQMQKERVKPNSTTFRILVAGFYREEKFDEVEKVMSLMRRCGVHPDINFYNVMIHSLCKLKSSKEAKVLFNGLRTKGVKPNATSFMHLVNGFAKEGKLGEARKKFKQMVELGFKPDSNCYFTLIHSFCEVEEFESALEFYKESAEKNWIPGFGTMTLLVNGLAKNSKVREARIIIRQMKERFPKTVGLWEEVESSLLL